MKQVYITGIGRAGGYLSKKELTAKKVLGYPYKPFGRMDLFSRLGFAGVFSALKDAGMEKWNRKRNVGIIASTVFGCIKTDIQYYETVIPENGAQTSPALFAYTLPTSFIGEAGIALGLTGESFIINEDQSRGIRGLNMAINSLFSKSCPDAMVCGICDAVPPAFMAQHQSFFSGAFFLVLEKKLNKNNRSHGALIIKPDNWIYYKNRKLTDMAGLASNIGTF